MGGRSKGIDLSGNMESFNDILTCLAGVLILIVILVVLDSKQAKVFIPTPITHPNDTNKTPVWIEVDPDGQLHEIPVSELNEWATRQVQSALEQHGPEAAMARLADIPATNGYYVVNLYQKAMFTNLRITPVRDTPGHIVEKIDIEKEERRGDWFGGVLQSFDKDRNYMAFVVRSTNESFEAFKTARARAWLDQISVAYTLKGNGEPLEFGAGGEFLSWQ